ncbi:MAG: hypothetical protein H6Q87_775, partial [candidate division NC10 bacterium]|nr:hypothetical protein [candidate division NC10 bacterium]
MGGEPLPLGQDLFRQQVQRAAADLSRIRLTAAVERLAKLKRGHLRLGRGLRLAGRRPGSDRLEGAFALERMEVAEGVEEAVRMVEANTGDLPL